MLCCWVQCFGCWRPSILCPWSNGKLQTLGPRWQAECIQKVIVRVITGQQHVCTCGLACVLKTTALLRYLHLQLWLIGPYATVVNASHGPAEHNANVHADVVHVGCIHLGDILYPTLLYPASILGPSQAVSTCVPFPLAALCSVNTSQSQQANRDLERRVDVLAASAPASIRLVRPATSK